MGPLLQTSWGQSGDYQSRTPTLDGNATFPGCTTISTAQVLYYYQYGTHATGHASCALGNLGMVHETIDNNVLTVDFTQFSYDYGSMASSLTRATRPQKEATAVYRAAFVKPAPGARLAT